MDHEEYLGQIVVVTMDDGTSHQGLLKQANGEATDHVIVSSGSELYYLPIIDIERVAPAALH